uniref:Uncharacterized protein n=1 Tax=Anguilla anguilla TaxID=7936 RepID=A0A0E9UZ46_ANGAN
MGMGLGGGLVAQQGDKHYFDCQLTFWEKKNC